MDRISAAEASTSRAIAERDAAHKAAHEDAEQRAAKVDARAVVLQKLNCQDLMMLGLLGVSS